MFKKVKNYLNFLHYKNILGSIGNTSILVKPVRIDGGKNIDIGEGTVIQSGSWLLTLPIDGSGVRLKIGNGCQLGHRNHITAVKNVQIGEKVLTASNVYISDNYHQFSDVNKPVLEQPVCFKGTVKIGDGSWIGENVCILGVSIGRNCVIGANSVVNKDIPDYCVAVGAPARVIRYFCKKSNSWVNGAPEITK